MSDCKELPCRRCGRVWRWASDKKSIPYCPEGYGCAVKSPTTEELFDEVFKRLDDIEQKIDQALNKNLTNPSPDPNYWQYPRTPNLDPMFGVIKCIKCGMEFRGATDYVCNTYGCPTFMQVTCGDVSVTTGSTSSYVGQGRRDNMSSPGDKNYED